MTIIKSDQATDYGDGKMKELPGAGKSRNYFEIDTTFQSADVLEKILAAYGVASAKAALSARIAISSGAQQWMANARWDEAVAATIEQVLCLFQHKNSGANWPMSDFVMPERPGFEI